MTLGQTRRSKAQAKVTLPNNPQLENIEPTRHVRTSTQLQQEQSIEANNEG